MIPELQERFLRHAAKVLKRDERLKGVAVGGSYISGDMDIFSDLDMVIAVASEKWTEVMNERIKIAEGLGELLSCFTGEHVGEPRLLICLYGPELVHVDLKFVSVENLHERVENPIILWERDRVFTKAFEKESASFPMPDYQWIEDRFWVWLHYGATKLGRGELFETIEFLSFLRQTVIGSMILIQEGKLPRGVRRMETDGGVWTEKLKETIPVFDKKSCGEALQKIGELYAELRKGLVPETLIYRAKAEEAAKEYLKKISREL